MDMCFAIVLHIICLYGYVVLSEVW